MDIRSCHFLDTNIFGYSFVSKSMRMSHFEAKLCNVFLLKKNLLIDIHDVGNAEANINFCSILARNWWWNQELLVPIIIPGL